MSSVVFIEAENVDTHEMNLHQIALFKKILSDREVFSYFANKLIGIYKSEINCEKNEVLVVDVDSCYFSLIINTSANYISKNNQRVMGRYYSLMKYKVVF